ncbi:MAG: hypothetical protein IMZ57_09220 [Acidobacteria bacterium]|nr:hypothetical protein [Acidobacteriota bacterium]
MSMATFFFIHDLAEQCMFVRMAKIDLKKCLTSDNYGLDRPYYFLQSLVIALGNISKILWPKKRFERRGIELRTFLEVKNDSALRNRDLRNLFEHFDEKADDWFAEEERNRFSDRGVGSIEGMIIPTAKERLRVFNPETWTMTCMGQEYRLGPAIQAAYELYEMIQEKTGQPGKKVQPLPGEFDE